MAAFSLCLSLVFVSAGFYPCAEAVASSIDVDRVLIAYSSAYDNCKGVSHSSSHESKAAADKMCEDAFKALDRIKINECRGWRHPGCRFVKEVKHYQCTCMISNCDDQAVRSNIQRSFRDCAPRLWTIELASTRTLAPTANFRQGRRYYDDALLAADLRRSSNFSVSNDRTGSSSSNNMPGANGNTSVTYPSNGGGATNGFIPGSFNGQYHTKPYPCEECGEKFRSTRTLFDHKRVHHTLGDTHCYMCNRDYKSRKTFLDHLKRRHPKSFAEETESMTDPVQAEKLMPYSCAHCGKRYGSKHGLRGHEKSHTTNDTRCPCCNQVYSTRSILKTHMQNFHPGEPLPERAIPNGGPSYREPIRGSYVCNVCGKAYTYREGLLNHKKSHFTLDTYCFFCDATFTTVYNYRTHMRNAHPEWAKAELEAATSKRKREYPVECQQCPKRFKNDQGLREHKDFHDGKTKCNECDEVLPRLASLYKHKKIEHPK